MANVSTHTPPARDLLSLARSSSMPELLAALEEEQTLTEADGPVPPRANQIARLIISKAVWLIRLGTQAELAEAAVEVAKALVRPSGKRLGERHPQAHRLLSGASVALRAATSPSSSGGEVAVLRSWKGKARRTVELLDAAEGERMPRATLREELAIEDESLLSHLLFDLEAAGLVVRIRDGRAVMVHLGPTARCNHVREFLGLDVPDKQPQPELCEREARSLFQAILDDESSELDLSAGAAIEGLRRLRRQISQLRHDSTLAGATVEETVTNGERIVCRIRVSGTMQLGPDDGSAVERWLVWTARLEDGKIVEVGEWSPPVTAPRPSPAGVDDQLHEPDLEALLPPSDSLLGRPVPMSFDATENPEYDAIGLTVRTIHRYVSFVGENIPTPRMMSVKGQQDATEPGDIQHFRGISFK